MHKSRVTVLRGGPSDEFHVSMETGKGIIASLQNRGYDVQDIIIAKNGDWLVDGFVKSPEVALSATDVVFIALHGAYGEDGTVQRILDRLAIPYTGSGAFASSVAMNKVLTKEHLKKHGIKMAPHMKVQRSNTDMTKIVSAIEQMFGPEYVIKPVSGGSSVDTYMATGVYELRKALEQAFSNRDEVLVEKRIRGREATCGVVERFREQKLYRLPVVEIVPPKELDFFDHDAKYSGKTDEICPARFTRQEKAELEDIAHRVHEVLELSQYSRSDFILADDGIYFLEVNTLPGMTPQSLLPKSLEAVGCSYDDFVVHLLTDALR